MASHRQPDAGMMTGGADGGAGDAHGREDLRHQLQRLMPAALAHRVAAAATNLAGERRQVALLHWRTDVDAGEALDDEARYLLTDRLMTLIGEVIYRYEGVIEHYDGASLVALFGAPVAHENDTERAVQAALDLHDAVRPLQAMLAHARNVALEARAAVVTGGVLINRAQTGLQLATTVVDDAAERARVLCEAAADGATLVSGEVYRRTRTGFHYRRMPLATLGGGDMPQWAFAPVSVRLAPGRTRGLPGVHVPMIGRQAVLARTLDLWHEVRNGGQYRVVAISGEAGVGKTRLIHEFLHQIQSEEVQSFHASCLTTTRTTPLHLMADLLRDILTLTKTDTVATKREILRHALERLGVPRARSYPYLCALLGIPVEPTWQDVSLTNLDDAALQSMTHGALQQVLGALAERAPTVLIFEDLHWVDAASQAALQHLLRTLSPTTMLVILVVRDSEREVVLRPLLDGAGLAQSAVDLHLTPLSRSATAELVMRLLPVDAPEAETLRSTIVERSDGNPFYAEELVRMLLDRSDGSPDDARALQTGHDISREVPPTLAGLILARMDALPDRLRRTLQCASVIGAAISASWLAEVMHEPVREVERALHELVARQFLVRDVDMEASLEELYAFRHNLVEEAIYDTLLRRDRQQLHAQVAEVMETHETWSPAKRTEMLAYHFSASGEPQRAVPYLLHAAERAARRCAYQTAIGHYRQVLTIEDGARDDILQAQIGLGRALKFVGAYEEAKEVLSEALASALYGSLRGQMLVPMVSGLRELADLEHRAGDSDRAVEFLEAGLGAIEVEGREEYPALWRSVMDRMAWIRFHQGRLDEAFELASTATLGEDTDREDDPMTLASLHNTLGGIQWQKGNLAEAVRHVTRSLRLYAGPQYVWGMANAYLNLGVLHYALGAWDEAAEELEEAERLWEQIGDVRHQAVTLNNLGTLRQAQGAAEAAYADLMLSLKLFEQLGEPWGTARAHISLARLAMTTADLDAAATHARTAAHLLAEIDVEDVELQWIRALIDAASDVPGTPATGLTRGLARAEQALTMARSRRLGEQEAHALRVLGELRGLTGSYLEAEALLRESVDLCTRAALPYELGLAQLSLGRLYEQIAGTRRETADAWRERAAQTLQEAAAQFAKLGAARDLAEARTRLLRCAPVEPEGMASVPDRQLPEGEMRSVAVVWTAAAPLDAADDEGVFEALATVVPLVSAVAEQYHGQMVRQHQGLMVVFGAPEAQEDDAERAVRAAWELNRLLAQEGEAAQAYLHLGIGVALGQAVAGQIGSRFHTEFFVQGAPVEKARALAEQAPRHEVWVTDRVRRATERAAEYSGVAETSERAETSGADAVQLLGFREMPGLPRGVPGLRTRMIGRENALRSMLRLSQGLSSGLGGLIWIEGEPGIGKSRLMSEYAAAVATQGLRVWRGQCTPQSSSRVFAVFSDLLMQIFGVQPGDAPQAVAAKVDAAFAGWPPALRTTQPYLEVLLGVWPSGLAGERLSKLEPEQLRQQIFVSLRRFLKGLTQQEAVILLLDDLHWIDPIAAELLHFLLTMVASSPLIFVCAQRRQGSDAPNDRLVRAQSLMPDQTLRLSLDRLSPTEREQLLEALLPDVQLPDDVRDAILTQSDGNPYFTEEYVRMLLEQGHLARHEGTWHLRSEMRSDRLRLPVSLETLIRSRVDALPPDLRSVVQAAAVIGTPFETEVLQATLDTPQVGHALERLASRLLVRPGRDGDRWEFHHSMIAQVVYNGMLGARRKMLHAQVVEALEARWADGAYEHAEVLAFHLTRAGMGGRALTYLVAAGEHAAARFANEAAIDHLEAAAETLADLPHADDALRWRLAAALGDVYRAMGRHQDAMAALRACLALTQTGMLDSRYRAGLYRRMGETARKQGEFSDALSYYRAALTILDGAEGEEALLELTRARLGLAWTHFHQGAFGEALEAAREVRRQAEATGAIAELSAAENLLGGIYYRQSQWDAAANHTRRAMVLREQMGYTWGVAGTLSNLAVLAVLEGDWHKARSLFEQSLALRAEMDDAEGLALVYNNLGTLSRDQGELEEATAYFRQSLETIRPFAEGYHFANAMVGQATVLHLMGQVEEAQACLDRGLALASELGANDVLADGHRMRIELLLGAEAYAEAWEAAKAALQLARQTGNRSFTASVWRLLAELELRQHHVAAARDAITQAQQIVASVTDMLERGRVHAQAARVALAGGHRAAAEPDLRAAQRIFMQLGADLDLIRLREVMGTGPLPEADPAS